MNYLPLVFAAVTGIAYAQAPPTTEAPKAAAPAALVTTPVVVEPESRTESNSETKVAPSPISQRMGAGAAVPTTRAVRPLDDYANGGPN